MPFDPEIGVADDTSTAATNTHAIDTVAVLGVVGKRILCSSIFASYSATAVGLLTVKFGTTTEIEHYIYNEKQLIFPDPLVVPEGVDLNITLADGGAAIVGKVSVQTIQI